MDYSQLQSALQVIGKQAPDNSQLILIGGSALILLGSPRQTFDIDFVGDDVSPTRFQKKILKIARELKILVELVPLDNFIPIPAGSAERNIYIGIYSNLKVYVADPYSIAFSKLDRGFDTDIEDIVFLINNKYVEIAELEKITYKGLQRAREFDMNINEILSRLQEVKESLK